MEDNKGTAEVVDRKLELEKCRNSPYYFFTKYITVDGNPATTILSEKDFNSLIDTYSNSFKVKSRRVR